MARGHAEALPQMIESVLSEAGASFADIRRVACDIGPGGFTSIRVGVAAARALGLALEVPALGFSSLAIVAAAHPQREAFRVAFDAGHGEIFAQGFTANGAPKTDAVRLSATNAAHGGIVIGSGAALLTEIVLPTPAALPDARALAMMAADADPAANPATPLYLRAAAHRSAA